VWYLAGVVLRQTNSQVVGDADVEMLGIETLKDIDVFHRSLLPTGRIAASRHV
jgi:hypothetical protein